jgi:hypothetical protein
MVVPYEKSLAKRVGWMARQRGRQERPTAGTGKANKQRRQHFVFPHFMDPN